MKHVPFDSIYRPDFEVVEQREGKVRYFPHTAQLPLLHRALNLEFRGGLPSGIAKTNAKSDGFRKVLLAQTVSFFCNLVNGGRKDGVLLFQLYDRDLLARVAVVQQVTEDTPRGACHRFRFYAGEDFSPEIYLSGKELIFADHVMQRFGARVPHPVGEDLSLLLLYFLQGQCVAMPVNGGRGFLEPHGKSFLAFPFKESENEYFITTCLTLNEVHHLGLELPPQGFNLHYDREFTPPQFRNWLPIVRSMEHYKAWQGKVGVTPALQPLPDKNWYRVASFMKETLTRQGHGPGSQIYFLDNIPGPSVATYRPGENPGSWNERDACAQVHPEYDWDQIIRERDEAARRVVPVFEGVQRPRPRL